MIKIALVSHSGGFSGGERMLFNLAKLLKNSDGIYPILVMPQDYGAQNTAFWMACRKENIETVPIYYNATYICTNDSNKAQIAGRTQKGISELIDVYHQTGVNVVLCNTATCLAPMMAARYLNIPVVTWVHGILDSYMLPLEYDAGRRLLMDRLLMELSDQIVCCSQWTARYYAQMTDSPIQVIHNWTPHPEKVNPMGKSNKTFVCLNTFEENKGIRVLLEAVSILAKEKIDFSVELYGSGETEVKLKEYVDAHHLKNCVKFKGRTTDIESVYNNAYCLVQPSFIESFGMTVIETMSYGRPVIATMSGGPQEIIKDGETGFLIPRQDAEALAEKMKYLLHHPDEAIKMGKRGQMLYQEKFSEECVQKAFCPLIRQLTARPQVKKDNAHLLLEDFAGYLLRSESKSSFNSEPAVTVGATPAIPSETRLAYSGNLKKRRTYFCRAKTKHFKSVGFIFSCHDTQGLDGQLTVKLYHGRRLLATAQCALKDISLERWQYLMLDQPIDSSPDVIAVKLEIDYTAGSGSLALYEDREKRGILYKICNRLGCHLPGMDAIIMDMRD